MKIEIHWPIREGVVDTIDLSIESNIIHSALLTDFIQLSYDYDVIIDNGKITFVDKE